jgi:hypothetical protein
MVVMRFPTDHSGSSGAGHCGSGVMICGDAMARMKKATPGGVVSRHDYVVRIVTARLINGDAVCLMAAMSFRGMLDYVIETW